MIKPKFFGKILNGELIQDDSESFQKYLATHFEGKEIEMTVGPKYKRRTQGDPGEETNFNGYYWAVVVRMIADEMGEWDQDVVHDYIQMAVGNVRVMKNGIKLPAGTKEMSGVEFAEYCSKVRTWANSPDELNLYIPEPHECDYEK